MDTYTVDDFLDYCYGMAVYQACDNRDPSRKLIEREVVDEKKEN